MSEFVKVKKSELISLLSSAADAHSMLDDVHCYDTEVYEELGNALSIEYEEIECQII